MSNIERIEKLASAVDVDMQEDVESVVINAGKYVAAVTEMECSVRNMQGLKGQDYRDRVHPCTRRNSEAESYTTAPKYRPSRDFLSAEV